MKTLLTLIVLWPLTLAAQTPLDTLTALRPNYPTPMSHEQLGDLLNRVAWAHRDEGYGLHLKPTGNRCPQPGADRFISCDILVGPPGLTVYDVLIDVDGPAEPTWILRGDINTPDNFVQPVQPDGAPDPTPEPDPSLVARVTNLERLVAEGQGQLAEGAMNILALQAALDALTARVWTLEQKPLQIVPTTCKASVFGIPIACRLEPVP